MREPGFRPALPAAAFAMALAAGVTALPAEIRHEIHGDEIVATNVAPKVKPEVASLAVLPRVAPLAPQPIVPSTPPAINDLLAGSAVRYGFDPGLIQAVVAAESAFDQRAVSRSGARGLMQLMPDTARQFGLKDVQDPATNLEAGVAYLRDLVSRFNGDVGVALAAYNAGPESVARYGGVPPYEETHQYLQRIRSFYGEDLNRGDRLNGSTGIRLSKIEEGGVPLYTNLRPRRIPKSVTGGKGGGHR